MPRIIILGLLLSYFYPVRLDPLKKAAGKVFDYVAARSVKK
jgi:hypothetical protein